MGCLIGYLGGGAEEATEATVLVAGCTVDGSAVCSIPTGVVAVSVFYRMDGIAAAFIYVAVVTIDTAVVKVFGACGNYAVVRKICTNIGTMTTETVC